jgi:hypothetical protein
MSKRGKDIAREMLNGAHNKRKIINSIKRCIASKDYVSDECLARTMSHKWSGVNSFTDSLNDGGMDFFTYYIESIMSYEFRYTNPYRINIEP